MLKYSLLISLFLISKTVLAVPSAESMRAAHLYIFVLFASPVLVVWFSISAAVALTEKRNNLDSLYFSSASMLCCFIICLKNALTVYDYTRWENINAIFIFSGIIVTVLVIDILATYKFTKRRQEKELE